MDWKQLYNDFRQKYEHCYCLVTLEGYKQAQVFFLEFVEPIATGAPLLHLRNENLGEVILKYDDSKSEVDFKFPPLGLYNSGQTVVMLRRAYERQWKKGMSNGTLFAISLYEKLHPMYKIGQEEHLSCKMLQGVFAKQKDISLKEGVDQLTGRLAVRLSSEFALGLSPTEDTNYLLWYHENPIGKVDTKNHRIYLRETQFEQEYEDFAKQNRDSYEFVTY